MPTSNSDEAHAAGPAPAPAAAELPPLAVTMGDPAGIGPDITLISWLNRAALALPAFVLVGDAELVAERALQLGLVIPIERVSEFAAGREAFARALPVLPVRPAGADQSLIVAGIEQAVLAVLERRALAMVTNPLTKSALNPAGLSYPGHTEYLALLAERFGGGPRPRPVMMLAAEELKVVPATVHVPIAAVPSLLTRELRQDFGLAAPRIAVTGLNPHAGEDGLIGKEERDLIGPVLASLAARGLAVTGPHAADTLFHAAARRSYDAVVAMYHDQALIPLKTLAFDRGVNITLGLPFVRTSPDHGTAFSLAGTGKARPGSFVAALRLAAEIGARRRAALGPQRR
jgi:4-hydroxythreonine-4-phosphate dehydrogenase